MDMIGRLRGILLSKRPPHLLLEVSGVGYEVEAPLSTFVDLPELGAEFILHTHLSVREDAHVLYGFAREGERTLFRELIRVSGVGPKLALAILSGMDGDSFLRCMREQDTAALSRIPGIGKKTAARLLVELRDRLQTVGTQGATAWLPGTGPRPHVSPEIDARAALETLGYRPAEAARLVSGVETKDLASEEIVRRALQGAMQR
jgi:Holliday junction DNA helicase RuvA